MTAAEQETLPVLPAGLVRALPGADDDRDAGVVVSPRDPAATLQRFVEVLLERTDLRRELFVLLHVGEGARRRMAMAVLTEHPYLLEVFSETFTGPEARALAAQIRDVAPGQCLIDRHCGMGEDHDGGCWPRGGE